MGMIFVVILIVLLVSIFLGAPVACSIGFTGLVTLLIFMEPNCLKQFGSIAYNQGTNMNQLVAPLFILMAEFLARGGIAEDLFAVLNKYLRRFKGGLALSTTLACTIFAALCGSSPATAASIGRISVGSMTRRGYDPGFAVGTVAGGGTLGIMIPPSITFVTYGILTETSIAKLLMAGLLPGIMLSALMCISIIIRVHINPALAGDVKKAVAIAKAQQSFINDAAEGMVEEREKQKAEEEIHTTILDDLKLAIPAFALIFIVLGAMYTGLATPTESAGFGAMGAFVILLIQRRMNWNVFRESMKATARTGCMIIFLLIGGFCLSYVISYLGLAQKLASTIAAAGVSKWVMMILLYILWFILGCLMDPGSMVILTIPFVFETLTGMGFDPIWIGVVSTLCVEIGMITPPVGLNLFILRSSTGVPMTQIIKGSLPYVLVLVIGLVILNLFPQIALFLPSLM